MDSAPHQSSAKPLSYLYAGLVIYASLYPFHGWRPTDEGLFAFVALPWPRWWTAFDLMANFLGYLPLGALIFGAMVRTGRGVERAMATGWLMASGLSLVMESAQNFLTPRVASNVDLLFNSLGAAFGVALALAVHKMGWVDRWQVLRDRWFLGRSAGGLTLLVLWPFGLLFPTPVALGLGRILPRLREPISEWLGTALPDWFSDAALTLPDTVRMSAAAEVATIALGLLAPCLLAFTIARPGWRRSVVLFGLAGSGFAATTLSTALNFGPEHAFAWLTGSALQGMAFGGVLAAMASRFAPQTCVSLGLIAVTALVVAVAQAPADPYFAQSLQAWEQGNFIRFHGAAQWVGWLWPFAVLFYLLLRTGRPERGEVQVEPPT
jgi:VanZ family protein